MEHLITGLIALGFKVESYTKVMSGLLWEEKIKFNHPTHKPYFTLTRHSKIEGGEYQGRNPYQLHHQKISYSGSKFYKKFNPRFSSERGFIRWIKSFIHEVERTATEIENLAKEIIGDHAAYYVLVDNHLAENDVVGTIVLFSRHVKPDNYYFKNQVFSSNDNVLYVTKNRDDYTFSLSLSKRGMTRDGITALFQEFELDFGSLIQVVKPDYPNIDLKRVEPNYHVFGHKVVNFTYQLIGV